MSWDSIQDNWAQWSGQIKAQWTKLSNDDLAAAACHRDKLAARIQERYGIPKAVAEQQLKDWEDQALQSKCEAEVNVAQT